jgi:hypothetical protein
VLELLSFCRSPSDGDILGAAAGGGNQRNLAKCIFGCIQCQPEPAIVIAPVFTASWSAAEVGDACGCRFVLFVAMQRTRATRTGKASTTPIALHHDAPRMTGANLNTCVNTPRGNRPSACA